MTATDPTSTTTDETPAYRIHFDYFPDGRAFGCALCDTGFHGHVVPLRYPTGDIDGGRWICRPCLTQGSARLASIAEGLELIALAGHGSDEALGMAQAAISAIRTITTRRAIEGACEELHGSYPEPETVHVAHDQICDDSDLFVTAYLSDGQPQVRIVDRGGWPFLDDDPDAALAAADTIRDMAVLARMAAQL